MKHLKVGDKVIAVFLGSADECEVIEITDKKKKLYKLKMKTGTILPGVTWFKLLDDKEKQKKPWHILKYIGHKEPKVMEKENIPKTDLDEAIEQQRKFLRGEIKD
jgi:hypothetical protein